ncbi:CUT1 family carbohydrate ABC transporter membrane protein 1 [Paenibacillus sp. FSL R7-277]|uniref:ABC transporter permease n=1 Tax=Paenibacillus sp. FSL R7-277 TaxID=1227352 RepID=UPI0003E2C53E|nr:ABC transporter permease subunit [Paenibacillus sp. FSL R7-277]ETT61676.1 CUT1 family carbohydrate ABC transporter membrane protein 1 [Paenibacillus sp. FSL R7-277]
MTDSEATLAARKSPGTGRNFRNKDQLSLQTMILPGIIFILVFTFIPLYGVLIAFKEYNIVTGIRGIFTAEWVGLDNFKEFVNDINFWNMLRNTLGINILGLLINFPLTILFALMLNELTSQHFKKLTQTVTYLPHFISWSIFGGLIINILSPSSGVVNYVLLQLGIISEPIHFLGEQDYFWLLAVLTNLVKELGWGAILYLAAIAGIDQEMYEAAYMDGATRFQRIWHITLPSITGTIVILLVFSISNILNSGFDQFFVLQNPLNIDSSEVIDTYVYKVGLREFRMEYATAVGLMKTVIALILLYLANLTAKKITKRGIF